MSTLFKGKQNADKEEQIDIIKKFLKDKNLYPKKSKDLKKLLSFTLNTQMKKPKFEYLLNYLLNYINSSNESIFYEFLFKSCELGNITNVQKLLENGLNVNCQNNLGQTPLHIAISKNNIELIKLLIKFEPDTNISTKKDGLTAMNYAEIQGNKNIINIINDLNEKNKKKIIKSEIIDYINKDMNNISNLEIDDNSLFINKDNNFDDIQNYNGEKMSIMINDEDNNNTIINNHHINVNNLNENTINQTIFNESEYYEDISPKNTIKIINFNNINDINYINNVNNPIHNGILNIENHQNVLTEESINDKKISKDFFIEPKLCSSPLKKKEELSNYCNYRGVNLSCAQSLTTSNTMNKDQYELPLITKKTLESIDKKAEISKFISEINLPEIYAKKLIENGFDDLEMLISQEKNGMALYDQNLKEIGISIPGDRAKILIHLEELAGNFEFPLEKEIIYSNKILNNINSSLYNFFSSIDLEEYINTFKEKGYYNAELLLIQMVSKHPINEDILKKDFGVNKIGHVKRIMLNLIISSENYVKKLKNRTNDNKNNKSIDFLDNPNLKVCDICFIF